MPLKGTEKALAKEIVAAIKSESDPEKAWEIAITKIFGKITSSAVVTGACPSSGGPLTGGKIS